MDDSLHAPRALAHDTSTLLRLEGRDALDLLHRISTQALEDLTPGTSRATLFCDFRGRLLHRAYVAMTSDKAVWLLRDDAPTMDLNAFIERHVFREDVKLGVPRSDWLVRTVPGSVGLAVGAVRERDGLPHEIQLRNDFALVLVPPTSPPPDASRERARIMAGQPRHGHEISEAFNPFEVGLGHEVHLSKGCFTGQEALMRLMTYNSVRRRLARVTGAGAPPQTPHEIHLGAASAGWLTSVAVDSPQHDEPRCIGLAVLKHDATEADAAITLDGTRIHLDQVFAESRPLGLP